MKTIYLDYAAATPLDNQVLAAMQPYFAGKFYNPSANYLAAKDVHDDLSAARSSIAGVLGARPAEIIFTAGGTEANNLAILGVCKTYPKTHIVTTALEHDSVLAPIKALATRGWQYNEVAPDAKGIVSAGDIAKAIRPDTVLVSVMYANNEIGTVQPLRQIARQLGDTRNLRKLEGNTLPLYFHTDAAQAANYLDLHVHRLGVDMMTLNGGKIYGPKQSGVLYSAAHIQLEPLLYGGGQERGFRSGTENVAANIGFAAALEKAQAMRHEEMLRLQELQRLFIQQLQDAVPGISLNGSHKYRLPNNIHVSIAGADNERLLFGLDEAGIQCAAGSACSASKEESSHVLKSIGLSDQESQSSLRFSLGRNTTLLEIKNTVAALAKLAG